MAKKAISKKIENAVKNYASHLRDEGLPIKNIYIYGSYAKGTARRWSDIDVCVISTKFDRIDPLTFLWKNKRNKDVEAIISPVGFHPDDFRDEDPLAWEIKKIGIRITIDK
ncbi:MAG: nucleotidyltransferase domain-containing protein [bacterium]